ncbi:MAG TPA: electron transfer flavoprotein subunit beta/FixA family protein [Thermoplasmata archaeon]|nr:electron transfer flavoprotein subunit beta/FixA family protein [Thermoplasmata archaeon]
MDFAVLIKPVPEAEARLRPDRAGQDLDADGVKFVLAGYDESAVEQALLLRDSIPGATVRAISLGPVARCEEVLRSAIALGVDAATSLDAPPELAFDPVRLATGLTLALTRHPAALVLTGKQSLDEGSGCLSSAVAELLGLPDYGSVTDLRWDAPLGRFTLRQIVEGEVRSITIAPPVLIGLQQAWNDPRTAKLPMILKSRKAAIERIARAELEAALAKSARPPVRTVAFQLPPPRTGAQMIEYRTPEEAAEKLVQRLSEEAKVLP